MGVGCGRSVYHSASQMRKVLRRWVSAVGQSRWSVGSCLRECASDEPTLRVGSLHALLSCLHAFCCHHRPEMDFVTVVDDTQGTLTLVQDLSRCPRIFLAAKAAVLGPGYPIALLQISTDSTIYLVDLHVLGKAGLEVSTDGKPSLRSVLEGSRVQKVVFDARNLGLVLSTTYQVQLSAVYDLQVAHMLLLPGAKFNVGLSKSLVMTGVLTGSDHVHWSYLKQACLEECRAQDAFQARPLNSSLYLVGVLDIFYYRLLFTALSAAHPAKDATHVMCASQRRLRVGIDSCPPTHLLWAQNDVAGTLDDSARLLGSAHQNHQ